MNRRRLVLMLAAGAMIALAGLAGPKKQSLLLLDWAARAELSPATGGPGLEARVAVLIEMGLKDQKPTPWSNRATVTGAKILSREGYRFRDQDKLVAADGWEASSHYPTDVRPANPAAARQMRVASVGVVLHLADVQPDAALTIHGKEGLEEVTVALKDIMAGQTKVLWDGQGAVRRIADAIPVVTAKTEDDFPAAAYGPDGTLWVAYISYTLREEQRRKLYMQIKEQPADFKAFYTPEFGDQLFVKYYRKGQWSEPLPITGAKEDLVRCAIAVAGDGTAWVVYSANRQGNYDLYTRPISSKHNPAGAKHPSPLPGPERRLTRNPGPDLTPVTCTDQAGRVWLAYQSWTPGGQAGIAVLKCQDGKWSEGPTLPGAKEGQNRWYAALAAAPDGKVAVAYDVYKDGDYDVHVAVIDGDRVDDYAVATSGRFEARPSLAYDAKGRLWIAHEEGPEKWGKDYGALDAEAGYPLYNTRSVRLACLEEGKLTRPLAELPTSTSKQHTPNLQTPRYAYPKLGLDGKGRLWLAYRYKLPTPFGVRPGTEWLTYARRLDGDTWTEPIEVHHSDGLLDSRPVLLPHAGGGLLVVTNTDGRHATPEVIDNQIYACTLDLPGEPVEPKLQPHEPGTKESKQADEERAAVQRIRAYRVESGDKKYRLLRGEFHRHTEISFDGGSDGSLEDCFRYAIDVAALDWIGNTDHDSGHGREYSWWLIQKHSDAYRLAKAFTPMFAYERSVPYPHGHRNPIFAKRGVRTLPRLAEPDPDKRVAGVHADDTKMLYRYLKELDGICASHTSATSMGTDWRDNDPQVEPVVEIYQGDRNSYEKEGAPRAGYDPQSGKKPANIAGWYPKGYINLALEKGYRLGFQSSSDHWSTHISYCVVLAEQPDRDSILAALKKRRCYAATDDILVDVRSGAHLMGEEFKTSEAPTLEITVIGTKPLARVDILKDSDVVQTFEPGKEDYKATWTDPKPTAGTHYYYVRVEQADKELAWGSPLWIDYAK